MNNKKIKSLITDYEANKIIANELIKTIESGDYKSWRKTWSFVSDLTDLYYLVIDKELAANIYSQEAITSINLLGLQFDIPAGFYLTFKQIKAHKLRLKSGSKGIPTYEPKFFYKKLTEAEMKAIETNYPEQLEKLYNDHDYSFKVNLVITSEQSGKEYNFLETIIWDDWYNRPAYTRGQYVLVYLFNNNDLVEPVNVKELWGVGDRKEKTKARIKAEAEQVKESYIKRSKIKYEETLSNRAFYRPSTHQVHMPKKTQFEKSSEYYQVMMHEFSHSTGHQSLLNRKTLVNNGGFGFRSKNYSKEELVAELSSLFILNKIGLLNQEIFKNSAAYIKSWGSNFGKSIEHNIINTIEHSKRASELILNINQK